MRKTNEGVSMESIPIRTNVEPETRDEVFAEAVHVPETAEGRATQQARFRAWRADSRYEHLWPMIDRLIEADAPPARNGVAGTPSRVPAS
jgi:hypothetical protein